MPEGWVTGRQYRRTRPRGFAAWNPRAESLDLVRQVVEVLEEYDHPLTLRQVFYRLVGAHGYPKDERAANRLGEVVNRARRAGRIPMEAIRDDDAGPVELPDWSDPSAFWRYVDDLASAYRRRPECEIYVEVWVEASGMVPQVEAVAHRYGVPVVGSGGFASVTAKHDAAVRLSRRAGDRPVRVLMVGDLDPSGESVMDSAAEDVATFAGQYRDGARIDVTRLGVTPKQVEQFGLPTAPQRPTDRRGDPMAETVQAEALDPVDLAVIVTDALDDLIGLDPLRAAEAATEGERAALFEALARIRGEGGAE